MNSPLIAAFFERDLTVAEEDELGRILSESVEAAGELAERAGRFYASLGLPVPELPEGSRGVSGVDAGNAEVVGGDAGGTSAGSRIFRGPGAMGLGGIAAAIGGSILIGGGIAMYLARDPIQPRPLADKPESPLESVISRADKEQPARPAGEKNVLRKVKDGGAKQANEKKSGASAGNILVVRIVLQESSPISVVIYSESGEKVFEKSCGRISPGKYEFRWDGLDNAGRAAEPGTYRIVVESNKGQMERTLHVKAAAKEEIR